MFRMYDFFCDDCKIKFEDLVRVSEVAFIEQPACPECNTHHTRPVISPVRTIGPTFSTEEYLSRAVGHPIRGYRDMEAHDREMHDKYGLVRQDPNSAVVRQGDEAEMDDARTRSRIAIEEGPQALEAYDIQQTAEGLDDWSLEDFKNYVEERDALNAAIPDAAAVASDAARDAGLPDVLPRGDANPFRGAAGTDS